MSEEKAFPSVPAIGTDKQDRFARLLANKLLLSASGLEDEIKAATGRDTLAVFPHYYGKDEASKIIDRLVAKCRLAGIEITSGRRGGKPRRGRGEAPPPPQPQPKIPIPYGTNDELLAELAARVDAGKISNAHLLAVLEKRGCSGTIAHASVNDCCTRLERLGYPGEAMKANPDLLGQAGELGRLLLEAYLTDKRTRTWLAEVAKVLTNAGLVTETAGDHGGTL